MPHEPITINGFVTRLRVEIETPVGKFWDQANVNVLVKMDCYRQNGEPPEVTLVFQGDRAEDELASTEEVFDHVQRMTMRGYVNKVRHRPFRGGR